MQVVLPLILLTILTLPAVAETLEERVDKLERKISVIQAQLDELVKSKAGVVATQPSPPIVGPAVGQSPVPAGKRITLKVTNKVFRDIDIRNGVSSAGVYWDSECTSHFDRPVRALKGKLLVTDLFDEVKLSIGWNIDKTMKPGETISETGKGIRFNQFMNQHQWLRSTDLNDMKMSFMVEQVIYEDGTKEETRDK
jgi:hypothetical protein